MPRNFSSTAPWRDTRTILRGLVGALLLANLIAAGFVLFPYGGSAEKLERDLSTLSTQVAQKQEVLDRSKRHASSVELGKSEGDKFLSDYFLPSRTASSTLLSELDSDASQAKVQPREHSYNLDPIDGSDTLSRMTITAGYEGLYADLVKFVHEIDRSPRMLIIESMTAAPQQGSDKLSVSFKLDTFVRDDGTGIPLSMPPEKAAGPASAQGAGQ